MRIVWVEEPDELDVVGLAAATMSPSHRHRRARAVKRRVRTLIVAVESQDARPQQYFPLEV